MIIPRNESFKMMNAPVDKNLIYSSSNDLNFLILFKLFMNVDYQFYHLLFLESFLEIHEKSILFLVIKKLSLQLLVTEKIIYLIKFHFIYIQN